MKKINWVRKLTSKTVDGSGIICLNDDPRHRRNR